jgi:hypothetical protein
LIFFFDRSNLLLMSKTQLRQEASARKQERLASELYDPEMIILSIRRYVELLGSGEQADCSSNHQGGDWRPHLAAARRLLGVRVTKDSVLDKCWHRLPEGFAERIAERLSLDLNDDAFKKLSPDLDPDEASRGYVALTAGDNTIEQDHPIIRRAKKFLLLPAAKVAARKAQGQCESSS